MSGQEDANLTVKTVYDYTAPQREMKEKKRMGKKKDKTTRKSLNIDTAVGTILSSGPTEGDWHLNLKSQTSRSRTSLFGVCLCVCLSLS